MTTAYFLIQATESVNAQSESLIGTGRPHGDTLGITEGLVATGITKCASRCVANTDCEDLTYDVEADPNFTMVATTYNGKFCVVVNSGDYRKDRMVSVYVKNSTLSNGKAVDSLQYLGQCAEIVGSEVRSFRKFSGVIL